MQRSFVYEHAPFPSAHASTIAAVDGGLVCAWFGGTREGHGDVAIWVARRVDGRWLPPVAVANGRLALRRSFPCWNPVLFPLAGGDLLLFYKVGASPSRWWGMMLRSADGGRSWSPPQRLPDGVLGPIKNKPIALADGRLLCPSSDERGLWRVHLETYDPRTDHWERGPSLDGGGLFAAIQPCLLHHAADRLQLLCRTRQGTIAESWSADEGCTWSPLQATGLPNPDSGIDAVRLSSGDCVLVYNPTPLGRSPLVLATSRDGDEWHAAGVLEDGPGEFSYPAVIEDADGGIHVTYTWNRRRICHLRLPPPDGRAAVAVGECTEST